MSQIASRTFSPPRMPVSQSWTTATFGVRGSRFAARGSIGSLKPWLLGWCTLPADFDAPKTLPTANSEMRTANSEARTAIRSLPEHLSIDLPDPAHRPFPGELADAAETALAKFLAQLRIHQDAAHGLRNFGGIERIDEQRGVTHDFGQRRNIGGNDRRAAGHRFERRKSKSFVERRKDEHARESVENGERLVRDEAEKPHVLVQLVAVHRAAQRRVLRDLVADDEQLDVAEIRVLPQRVERFDQALEILVRLDVARVEHVWGVQLVALAHPLDLLGGRRLAETIVNGV